MFNIGHMVGKQEQERLPQERVCEPDNIYLP